MPPPPPSNLVIFPPGDGSDPQGRKVSIPDITGDDVPDTLIAAPEYGSGSGALFVVPGSVANTQVVTGRQVVATLLPPVPESDSGVTSLAVSMKEAGDYDLDGRSEIWLVVNRARASGTSETSIVLVNTATKEIVVELSALGPYQQFVWNSLPTTTSDSYRVWVQRSRTHINPTRRPPGGGST